MNECNHLEKCGEITDYCSSVCPSCKGDLCMHEYDELLFCKENMGWQRGITVRKESN